MSTADSKPKKKSMDFVPTELTPQQKQLQEQAEKYKKMRLSKVRLRFRGRDLYLCYTYTATKVVSRELLQVRGLVGGAFMCVYVCV